jgi:hypothetical protein
MLLDPLSDDPIVITGSANFSEASTTANDENMLVIRCDSRVADIYLGEFMRLFTHFRFRGKPEPPTTRPLPDPATLHRGATSSTSGIRTLGRDASTSKTHREPRNACSSGPRHRSRTFRAQHRSLLVSRRLCSQSLFFLCNGRGRCRCSFRPFNRRLVVAVSGLLLEALRFATTERPTSSSSSRQRRVAVGLRSGVGSGSRWPERNTQHTSSSAPASCSAIERLSRPRGNRSPSRHQNAG